MIEERVREEGRGERIGLVLVVTTWTTIKCVARVEHAARRLLHGRFGQKIGHGLALHCFCIKQFTQRHGVIVACRRVDTGGIVCAVGPQRAQHLKRRHRRSRAQQSACCALWCTGETKSFTFKDEWAKQTSISDNHHSHTPRRTQPKYINNETEMQAIQLNATHTHTHNTHRQI